MTTIELFSKKNCKLCDEAKSLLYAVNRDYNFDVAEKVLKESDPLFEKYKDKFPVILASNGMQVWGKISEEQIRDLLLSLSPPPRIYYVAKFLEALAVIIVLYGLIYGFMGDMWTDLYFFLAGIAIFLMGREIEKWEVRTRKRRSERSEVRSSKNENKKARGVKKA